MSNNVQNVPENLEDVKDFQCCFNSMSKESGDVEKQEDSEAVQTEPSIEENDISGNIAPENEPAISEIPNTPKEMPDDLFEALLKRAFTVKKESLRRLCLRVNGRKNTKTLKVLFPLYASLLLG